MPNDKLPILNFIFKTHLLVLAFIICNLSFIIPVSAHVLETDSSIGAVFHMDPDDNPIAKEPTRFYFEFKDTQNKFDPKNCDCQFYIFADGKQIYSQLLYTNNPEPSLSNASVSYTFPEKNIYQIKVTGKPTNLNAFSTFTLTYDVRVERVSTTTMSDSQTKSWFETYLIFIIGAGLAGLAIIGYLVKMILQRNKASTRNPSKNV